MLPINIASLLRIARRVPPQQALARVSSRIGDDIAAIDLYNKV